MSNPVSEALPFSRTFFLTKNGSPEVQPLNVEVIFKVLGHSRSLRGEDVVFLTSDSSSSFVTRWSAVESKQSPWSLNWTRTVKHGSRHEHEFSIVAPIKRSLDHLSDCRSHLADASVFFFQELITERFFGNPNAVLLWQNELVREILVALETRQISKFDSDSEALNSVRFDSAQFPLIQLICVKFKL